MTLNISDCFDSGNIVVKKLRDPENIELEIRKDNGSDFYQWFHFKVSGACNEDLVMRITNAGGAAYLEGWPGYQACASYDRENWFRIETSYAKGVLTLQHTPELDTTWFAYFAPFSMERHLDLIAAVQSCEGVTLEVLGETLDGQTMDCIRVGEPSKKKRTIWVTARQHPGETMAEWWMEGFLDRLLDPDDPVARKLRSKAVFHIVPNMNPDGSKRGHLRTNAKGVNLNREWDKASLENSPEVFHVLKRMRLTGIDLALDVHGDEALPYNFIAGGEGAPNFDERGQANLNAYKAALASVSPDFQTKHGYDVDAAGTADLSICTNYLANEFGCLAMTLEMPFKDNADLPDPVHGWSPERCRKLGAANLEAMLALVGQLR
ncbi:M14-type cytosolic carboxypeptidase [uncultured Maricaulis sp.]|uniref:M14 family metallopeptidase n=1 Tax=uncultured Maricaulis sp. TaxID=174710 RepID=UPI0030DBDAAE|tara:strand:- start:86827 stop:87960 length:1134 start_codon:yes stop_codon:yes gene_type:complete